MTFRDLAGLSNILKTCLIGTMIAGAISLWSEWLQIQLLQDALAGVDLAEADGAANDLRQGVVGLFYFVVYVTTGVIFLRWIYLSNRNAHALGSTGMQFTPGWAVGWYFVPVATFWKPYQAMKEMFQASKPGYSENWREAPHPEILPAWWALWIISNFAGQAVLRLALRADTVDQLLTSSWVALITECVDFPLGLVAIAMVGKLQTWQSEKHQALSSLPASSS